MNTLPNVVRIDMLHDKFDNTILLVVLLEYIDYKYRVQPTFGGWASTPGHATVS